MNLRPDTLWIRSVAVGMIAVFLVTFVPLDLYAVKRQDTNTPPFRPGDALRLTVWELRWSADGKGLNFDFNNDYPIDSRGRIQVPIIGEVKVLGYNQYTLADHLRELLAPYFSEPPVVVVEPLIRVTLMGAFNRPGSYLISPRRSLWDLADLAGGPTANADLRRMRIERGGRVIKKRLLSGYEKGVSLQEIDIRSGDQILVPARRTFTVRDFMEYTSFLMSIAILYLQINRNR